MGNWKWPRFRLCQGCQQRFEPVATSRQRARYCSWDCYLKYRVPWNKGRPMHYRTEEARQRGLSGLKGGHGWNKGIPMSLGAKERLSQKMRKLTAEGRCKPPRPSGLEKEFGKILESYFPSEWVYTGDGKSPSHNGLLPDYLHKKRKWVLEIFGDYWHTRTGLPWHQTELGRIMAWNSAGYRCLVLWEHDLRKSPEDELAQRIRQCFHLRALVPP